MSGLRIYVKLLRMSILARMQYRADFATGIISVVFLNAVTLSLIGILVSRFGDLNGWTAWQVVFLYSFWMLGHSLFGLLFWQFIWMEDFVVQGRFDTLLIRPAGVIVQFLGQGFQYMGIADLCVGIGGLSLAYNQLGLRWTVVDWLLVPVFVLSGTAIEVSLTWIIGSVSFWTGRSRAGVTVLQRFQSLVQQYPTDMFGGWFRVTVTTLLPVAFMNYYPSLVLLNKAHLPEQQWLGYASPAVGFALFWMARFVWNRGLRRYGSSGS